MPSSLMPADSNKALHLKLLDLLEDAEKQYHAVNHLELPEKIKKQAHVAYNNLLQHYLLIPDKKQITSVEKMPDSNNQYIEACKNYFFKFVHFYDALEALIVSHFIGYENHENNEYLKNSLNKIPDKHKYQLPIMPKPLSPRPGSEPISPRSTPSSPRKDQQEAVPVSPRKRGISAVPLPSFFKKKHKAEKTDQHEESTHFRQRSHSGH